jgi:glucose/mannose-6-phosphate isomerase
LTQLDDLEAIDRLDTLDVLGAMEDLAEQLRTGWELGNAVESLPSEEGVDSVAILGMGGSGSAGDIARVVAEPRIPVPFRVFKGYGELPSWIGRNSLVIASSYSGNTEETLEVLTKAHERGARIVTISSGGQLEQLAVDFGAAHVKVPEGHQPRASLGYLAMPVLSVLSRMELIPEASADVAETVRTVATICEDCHRQNPQSENPAKGLAARLAGKLPLIYGGIGIGAAAAYRFKCDLNEYAKMHAFSNEIPEANHNEIVGFESPDYAADLVVVYLRDIDEHPRIAQRFEIFDRLISKGISDSITIQSTGTSPLARILSLVAVTQFAAIYAGLALDVDPGPVEPIENLKRELNKEER